MLVELSVMEQRYQQCSPSCRTAGRSRRSPPDWASHARACTSGSPATNWGACPRWPIGRIARALALTRSPPRSRR